MKKLFLLITLVVGVIAFALPAQATKITCGLDVEFSVADDPQGPTPWVTAIFDDDALGLDPNNVRLTMSANNLVGVEYINNWYFNFDDALFVDQLSFTQVATSTTLPFYDATPNVIDTGINSFRPDGDGYLDILFEFPNGLTANRFTSGETVVYDISYNPGGVATAIDAYDFYHMGEPGPSDNSPGPFYLAAHIGGIDANGDGIPENDDEGSGWIGCEGGLVEEGDPVPEPATMLLLGSGLIGIAFGGKKRFKKTNK